MKEQLKYLWQAVQFVLFLILLIPIGIGAWIVGMIDDHKQNKKR